MKLHVLFTIFRLVTHQSAILPITSERSYWVISSNVAIASRDMDFVKFFIHVAREEFKESVERPHFMARWNPLQLLLQDVSPFGDFIATSNTELLHTTKL